MYSMFERRIKTYNLRNFQEFLTEEKQLCIMALRHLVIGLHNHCLFYQKNIKEIESLEIFNREVKSWICGDCPCRVLLLTLFSEYWISLINSAVIHNAPKFGRLYI